MKKTIGAALLALATAAPLGAAFAQAPKAVTDKGG